MALNNLGFGLTFNANDYASPVIRSLSGSLFDFDDQVKRTAENLERRLGLASGTAVQSLTRFAAGAAVAAVGIKGLDFLLGDSVDEAARLQKIMLEVQSKTGLLDDQIGELSNAFVALSTKIPLTADQLAHIGVVAGQLGIVGQKNIETLALVAGKFAVATGIAEEESALALARLAEQFGRPIEEAERLASVLVKLDDIAKADAKTIIDITGRAAGMAAQIGLTVDQTAALASVLADSGQMAESAGSSLSRLFAIAIRNADVFGAQIGLTGQAFTKAIQEDATGTLLKFFSAFKDVPLDQLSKRMVDLKLEGVELQRAFLTLVGQTDKLRDRLEQSNVAWEQATELERVFGVRSRALSEQMKVLENSWRAIKISIGQVLIPVVTMVVKAISTLMGLFQSLPQSAQTLLVVGATVAALTATAFGLVVAFLALKPVLLLVGAAAVTAAIPFLKFLAIVGLVAAAAVAFKAAWDLSGLSRVVMPIINRVGLAIRSLFALLTAGKIEGELAKALVGDRGVFAVVNAISQWWAVFRAFFRGIGQGFGDVFGDLRKEWSPVLDELGSAFTELFDVIFTAFQPVLKLMGMDNTLRGINVVRLLGRAFTQFVLAPLRVISAVLSTTMRVFIAVFRAVLIPMQFFADAFNNTIAAMISGFDLLSLVVTSVWNGIKATIIGVLNLIIGAFNNLVTTAAAAISAVDPTGALAQKVAGLKLAPLGVEVGEAPEGESPRASFAKPSGGLLVTGTPGPMPRKDEVSDAQFRALLEAHEQRMERVMAAQEKRPIQTQVQVDLDGQRVAKAQAQRERDARARQGETRPTVRGW